MDWENYRNEDRSINLIKAYRERKGRSLKAENYLERIEKVQPIKSRQAAAIAIETALSMYDFNM